MKAIFFLAAFCLWDGVLSFPDHGLKDRKQHKTVANVPLQNDAEGYFMENQAEKTFQNGELLDDVEIFGGAPLSSNVPFPPDVPSGSSCNWKKVGSLDMTDPTQQCPPSWAKIAAPRASCSKKTGQPCDSSVIGTSGASYQTVCGRFRGYQVGTPDAFARCGSPSGASNTIEDPYVDGISITYGPAGKRQHIFTYAAAPNEDRTAACHCPCSGGPAPPSFVRSDYYCESGNNPTSSGSAGANLFYADPLWDGQQCGGGEVTCCNPPNLPWFCKTFPTPITDDLEIRLCTDEGLDNENIALEFYELYIK